MSERGTPDANADQAKAWDGPEGDNWVENETFYNDATRHLTPILFDAAAIRPHEHVLDVGCGSGQTTRLAAAHATAGSALGVDLSSAMLARATEQAAREGLTNCRFERADAQLHPFEPGSHDIALSRYGVMFFDDPVTAFRNIGGALKPGGRIAMLVWREFARNEWVRTFLSSLDAGRDLPLGPPPGVPSPFALADPDHVRSILDGAGFSGVSLDHVEAPLYMGPDPGVSFESVKRLGVVVGLLSDLDDEARTAALGRLREAIEARITPDGVLFGTSSWLIRATWAPGARG